MNFVHKNRNVRLLVLLCVCGLLLSCSQENLVKEYFEFHGRSYPVDVSGISIFAIDYVDIDKDELMSPGAREYVEEGIVFAKHFLMRSIVNDIIAHTGAIEADKPVLFRDGSGEVGLMVRLTAFGSGKVESSLKLPVEWIGENKKLWKVENFAYFTRNEFYKWEYGGLVF